MEQDIVMASKLAFGAARPYAVRTEILDWLTRGTTQERFIDVIFQDLCDRLVASDLPLARATLHFRIEHPLWFGARIVWRKGIAEPEIRTFEHGTLETIGYGGSPVALVHDGKEEVRWSLAEDDVEAADSSLFTQLRKEGLTDYVAWPLVHSLGRRHVVSFASDSSAGFSEGHLDCLSALPPILSLVSEIRLKNRLARTLLETYVGQHASEEILDGAITRGSGKTVRAAILLCDLRDFTQISDMWPRDDVIELLNGYFDALCEPIERHGGEILKFMGDGLLAIFPMDRPEPCRNLLCSVAEARQAMDRLNEERRRQGRTALRYGAGIHLGDVMYGNIGSQRRLDFTVIGPAVNVAARLESLTKVVNRSVLVSRPFAEEAGCGADMESLGTFPLRGVEAAMEVFALVQEGEDRSIKGMKSSAIS